MDKTITIAFNENIKLGSNISGITLKNGNLPIDFTYSLKGNLLIIDPIENLTSDVMYTVNIPVGAIMDLAENEFAQSYTFSFTTGVRVGHKDTTQSDWQQGTLDKVMGTTAGDLEIDKKEDLFTNSILNPMWTWEVPKAGPTYSLNAKPGWIRISIPNTTTFDHWTTVNEAPKLKIPVVSRDWSAEMKYDLAAFTNGAYFHTGITVEFSPNEMYYWGPYKGTNLRLEKSGTNSLIDIGCQKTTGYLRVRKSGTTYYFDFKANEGDNWQNAGSHTTTFSPVSVGVTVKTWSAGNAVVIDSDYFRIKYIQGSRISPVLNISSAGYAQNSNVSWNATIPAQAELSVETNISLDGGNTWQGWHMATKDGEIPGITPGTNLGNAKLMYRATLSNIDPDKDLQLHDLSVSINSRLDKTAPVINSTDPQNGATNVPVDKILTVTFNEDIKFGPNMSGITLKKGEIVSNFTYSIQDNILTIQPEDYLKCNVAYSVYIPADAVVDMFDYPLANSHSFSFTTEPTWDHTATTQEDWQQGTLDKVVATTAGDLELGKKEDPFSESILNSMWTWETPKAGPTYSLSINPGWLRMSVPNTTTFDHWTTVNHAPKLITPVTSGDWSVETKYNLAAFTSGANFHAGLMVYFGPNSIYYWGPYQGTNLRLEKSGQLSLLNVNYGSMTGFLRIRKIGTTYYFDYKANEGDTWVNAGSHSTTTTPQSAGMIVKTWSIANTVSFDSDYFKLHYPAGYRVSPELNISSVDTSQNSQISWTATLPAGTNITVETNSSLDGGNTWQGWQPAINGGAIPGTTTGTNLTNGRLLYRASFSATDSNLTPQLHDITLTITPQG